LLTELTRAQHDPAMIEQVRALLEHAEKAKQLLARNDAKLAEMDFKITALTLKLAYYRRTLRLQERGVQRRAARTV
jgi:transposase